MPTWPATLPAPLIDGYTLQPFDNCTRSPMESGHQRVRLEFEGDKDFLTVNWLMTGDQFGAFRDWFKDDIADGEAWFDAEMDYDGEGMKAVEARFAAKFAAKHEPPSRWRVSAKLELKHTPLTELEQDNVLAGIVEKDVVLLWVPETQADVLSSKIGPDATAAYSGTQRDENGVAIGTFPALHSKGVWVGPGYSNLFTAGEPTEQTKTLTAQKYTVWCDIGSVVCGAYGTATAAAPLTFTATAGNCTFTPSGVTKWMLTATVAPMPYVAPGVTVASAAGSTTNGLSWNMAEEPDGVEMVANGTFGLGFAGWHPAGKCTLSVVNGRLRVTSLAAGTATVICYGGTGVTGVGISYSYEIANLSIVNSLVRYVCGASVGNNKNTGVHSGTAISGNTGETISFQWSAVAAGEYVDIDNVSVQRLTSSLMKCFGLTEQDSTELVANGGFDSSTGWAANDANFVISGGKLNLNSPAAYTYTNYALGQTLITGALYEIRFEISNYVSGGVRFTVSGGTNQNGPMECRGDGPLAFRFAANSGNNTIGIQALASSAQLSVDNVSLKRIKPAPCTVAALVTMGVGSAEMNMDSWIRPLTCRNANAGSGDLEFGKSSGGVTSIIVSYDGTTVKALAGTWSRNEQHLKIVQTNALCTQFRVGNKRLGIDSAIQWGSWATYDGSFNPLTHLRAAYSNTVPLWLRRVMVCKTGGLTEKQIEERIYA